MAKFRGGFGTRMTVISQDGVKSINPWDVDSDRGWTSLSGGDEDKTDEATFFRSVPWLYRAVKDRANNVSHMPYKIMLNGEEYDYEADTSNALDWLEGITTIFHKIEMSLALVGRAYCKLEVNPSGYIKAVNYLVPTAIKEHYDALGKCDYYEHTVKGIKHELPVTSVVAMYDPDWTTESGPGSSSAAKAALTSAGVLYHTDVFIARYFQRGAIKASVLVTLGFSENEALRLKHWWDTVVSGVKNAWAAVVLKGEAVKPTVIGEGLDSLQNETLTTERRQNIATALGVPESRMWSAAANYATRVQDDKAYYLGTIIPDCELIAEAWNEQVFTDEHNLDGYSLQFKPETLEIFQTGALDKAQAAKTYKDAGYPLLMASDLAGVALTPEQRAELEEMEAEPEPVPPALVPFAGQDNPAQQQAQLPPPAQEERASNPDMQNALAMWQRKAIKRFKESGSAVCEFVSSAIDEAIIDTVTDRLTRCKSIDAIKQAFVLTTYQYDDERDGPRTDQLRRALDWLEAHA
jgi:hypothetical protein